MPNTIKTRCEEDDMVYSLVFEGSLRKLSIAQLKEHLSDLTRIEVEKQRLVFDGKELMGYQNCREVGITDGVMLVLKAKVLAPPPQAYYDVDINKIDKDREIALEVQRQVEKEKEMTHISAPVNVNAPTPAPLPALPGTMPIRGGTAGGSIYDEDGYAEFTPSVYESVMSSGGVPPGLNYNRRLNVSDGIETETMPPNDEPEIQAITVLDDEPEITTVAPIAPMMGIETFPRDVHLIPPFASQTPMTQRPLYDTPMTRPLSDTPMTQRPPHDSFMTQRRLYDHPIAAYTPPRSEARSVRSHHELQVRKDTVDLNWHAESIKFNSQRALHHLALQKAESELAAKRAVLEHASEQVYRELTYQREKAIVYNQVLEAT